MFYLKLLISCTVLHFPLCYLTSYYVGVYTEYGKKEVEGAYVYNENTELKGEVTIMVLYTYVCILYRHII